MRQNNTNKITKKLVYVLPILLLILAFAQAVQVTHAQTAEGPWARKLQILNDQNATANVFNPFDIVQLHANVTYNNSPQSDVLVSFNIVGPSENPITISRIEQTQANGFADFSFRLPVAAQNGNALIGTWNVTATIDGAQPQTTSFTTEWALKTMSIKLVDSQGNEETIFAPGSNMTAQIAIDNQGPNQTANVTFNVQASGQILDQIQIQNTQISSGNQTQLLATLQIPQSARSGQAAVNVAIFEGNFNGTDIQAAENQTVYFTIASNNTTTTPTPTPTPEIVENSVSLFSWLLVATGIFTFTLLLVFLRHKPMAKIGSQIPNVSPAVLGSGTSSTETTLKPTSKLHDEESFSTSQQKTSELPANIPSIQQVLGSQVFAQLSSISVTVERIQTLKKELKVEREKLSKDLGEITKTVNEQQRAIKSYFDPIEVEIQKLQALLTDKEDVSPKPASKEKTQEDANDFEK